MAGEEEEQAGVMLMERCVHVRSGWEGWWESPTVERVRMAPPLCMCERERGRERGDTAHPETPAETAAEY